MCACPARLVSLQSNLRGYTMLINSLSPSEVFLEGSQWNEAGTNLYWKIRANHVEKKTIAEKPIIPTDA